MPAPEGQDAGGGLLPAAYGQQLVYDVPVMTPMFGGETSPLPSSEDVTNAISGGFKWLNDQITGGAYDIGNALFGHERTGTLEPMPGADPPELQSRFGNGRGVLGAEGGPFGPDWQNSQSSSSSAPEPVDEKAKKGTEAYLAEQALDDDDFPYVVKKHGRKLTPQEISEYLLKHGKSADLGETGFTIEDREGRPLIDEYGQPLGDMTLGQLGGHFEEVKNLKEPASSSMPSNDPGTPFEPTETKYRTWHPSQYTFKRYPDPKNRNSLHVHIKNSTGRLIADVGMDVIKHTPAGEQVPQHYLRANVYDFYKMQPGDQVSPALDTAIREAWDRRGELKGLFLQIPPRTTNPYRLKGLGFYPTQYSLLGGLFKQQGWLIENDAIERYIEASKQPLEG